MHMPGHKRNGKLFPWLNALGGGLDITEIDGFDNLNAPQTLFKDLEERAARLWGAGETIALVNGSTAGVLTAVRAALERGGELLMFRGSHKSVYHGAEIVRAKVHYLVPKMLPDTPIWGPVTPGEVAAALETHPDVRLVSITSPTYEGVISDIEAIAAVCHARGVPLLVDEAHGAHLGFGEFPKSAVQCGADLVVQSLHKTLPSLTQTALLHINGSLMDPADVRRNAEKFQTSSPSYLLSASIDGCVRFLEQEGTAAVHRWVELLTEFYQRMEGLENLKMIRTQDPSKLVISAGDTDLDGPTLMEILREQYRIELEMAHGSYVVAMTGMGDTRESLRRFALAVGRIDKNCRRTCAPTAAPAFVLPESRLPIHQAVTAKGELCPLAAAEGRLSGEYVWAYPPGTPLLVPGEVVSGEAVRAIQSQQGLHSSRGKIPQKIFCIDE